MLERGVNAVLLCKSGLIVLLMCLSSLELYPEQERNLGACAKISWQPELQCSKNEWLNYRRLFWCIFFCVYKGSSHLWFFAACLKWIFYHSVKSSEVRIVRCDPILLNPQIYFFVVQITITAVTPAPIGMLLLLALTGCQFCWAVKQSRVQAGLTLLSILPVSCGGFAALTMLRVVNASQRKRKSNSHDLFISPFFPTGSEWSSESLIIQVFRLPDMDKACNN